VVTDAEKMLEMMGMIGAEASQQTQIQLDTAAKMMKMTYDSYIKAGFSRKMAFELVKEMLRVSITNVKK